MGEMGYFERKVCNLFLRFNLVTNSPLSLLYRHVLVLAYPAGLQMWDCADLASISEVFNLNFNLPEWELVVGRGSGTESGRGSRGVSGDESEGQVRVVHAAVLPSPSYRVMIPTGGMDGLGESRPLLGIL
jgi:hypothetical protein